MESPKPKKSWLARYWWVILAGLLLVGMVVVLSCAICVGSGAYGVFSIIKSSTPFKESLRIVQTDPRAQQMLGTPIEAGFLVSGSISEQPGSGTAEISYPVSGPKGSGTVYVSAKKIDGEWVITRLALVMDKTKEKLVIIGSD